MSHPHTVYAALLLLLPLLLTTAVAAAEEEEGLLEAPLAGVELRCCTIPEPPIIQRDNSTVEGFSGIGMDYLRQVQLKLGFRCSSLKVLTDAEGETVSFDGVVEHIKNCTEDGVVRADDPACECDMGVGGWSINEDRFGRVDFVQPFVFDFYRVMTHANNTISPVGDVFFFTAFNTHVWVCIFVLISIFSVLKILDVHFEPLPPISPEVIETRKGLSGWARLRHQFVNSEQMNRVVKGFQSVTGHMMGYSTNVIRGDTRTIRQWVLNLVIFLSGLFLVLTYEASMTNALVNETWSSKFSGIDDFKFCRIPANQVCITKGTGLHAIWQSAIETRPCHQRKNSRKALLKDTIEDAFHAFLHYECKYWIGLGAQLEIIEQGKYCKDLRMTGEAFRDTAMSFILPQRSNISYIMGNATLGLRHSDLIPTTKTYITQRGTCNTEDNISISFVKLIWFFILTFIACIIVLVLTLYAMWGVRKGKRTNVKEMDEEEST